MATFYLNDGEAKNEPKVYNNNRLLPFCPNPSYLEIKLDRTKTIFARLTTEATNKLKMVANTKTLRTDALSLIYSTSGYGASVWCRSAWTRFKDSVLNNVLCIVTGYLRLTATDHLLVLSGIKPAKFFRLGAPLSSAYRTSLDRDHILIGSSDAP